MTARALSSDTTAYTEGTDITLSSESDNGTKICFSSEDAFSRTTYAASAVIAGIDTTAPSITVSSPTTAIALSKGVSAVDDDTGTTTWVYKLIAAATTCDSSALSSDTTAYTEGENITLSSEGDNGQKICFRSRDTLNRDTFAASTVIAGIDTTAPVITVSSPTITTAASKTVSATDDDTGTTTWVYKQIAAATTCDNSALTSDTNTYTEGDAITLSSESDNGTKICFSATDGLNRTTYAASAVIAGIDTTAPSITVSSPTTAIALSKGVSATDDDTGATTWVYKLINSATTCDSSALSSDTNTYTEGDTITLSSESDNGMKVCFGSTDALNRVGYEASTVISGIDTTAPRITVSSPTATPFPHKNRQRHR